MLLLLLSAVYLAIPKMVRRRYLVQRSSPRGCSWLQIDGSQKEHSTECEIKFINNGTDVRKSDA
jgi:hypothetical protein